MTSCAHPFSSRPHGGNMDYTDRFAISRAAAKASGQKTYFTGKPCKNGHLDFRYAVCGKCLSCGKISTQKYHDKNRLQLNKKQQDRYLANPSFYINKSRAYYAQNKDDLALRGQQRAKKWREKNKERHRDSVKVWRRNNPGCRSFEWSKARVARLNAMPAWLNKDQRTAIAEIYRLARQKTQSTGIQHDVDHIIPLRGKKVCGLHVAWNLQVISHRENLIKGNRIPEDRNA